MGCALEGQVRNGLLAGGRWIRTFGSRTRHQAVRPRRGRFPVIGSSPHWPGGTGISNLRPLAGWISALERGRFQGHKQKRKLKSVAPFARNRKFESISLQGRVCEPSVPGSPRLRSPAAGAGRTVRRLPVRLPALPSVARHWGCLSRGGQQSGQGVAADVHMGVLARIWLCGKEPGARCGEVAQRQSRRHPGMDRRGCGALLSGRRGRASHAPNVGFV
jgi:hypothetical protein